MLYSPQQVTDLKKILKEKSLSQSGTKSELIERLQSSISEEGN